jgi:hypothetical protein
VEKIVSFCVYLLLVVCCSGCVTGRGTMVSDPGAGTPAYRGIQEELRGGETELAVTGTKLEGEIRELGNRIGELEQSITDSAGTEFEIDEILQRIRGRKVSAAFVTGWGDSGPENEAGSGDRQGEGLPGGPDFYGRTDSGIYGD